MRLEFLAAEAEGCEALAAARLRDGCEVAAEAVLVNRVVSFDVLSNHAIGEVFEGLEDRADDGHLWCVLTTGVAVNYARKVAVESSPPLASRVPQSY